MGSTEATTLQLPMAEAPDSLFAQIAAKLSANQFFPLPLAPGTKRPFQDGWNEWADWRAGDFDRAGLVGIRNGDGGLFSIDVDFDDPATVPALRWAFLDSPCRVGKRGFVLLGRWADGLARTGHDLVWTNPDGRKAPIQIKAKGQTAAYGVHPDTGRLYEWEGERGPLNTPLSSLPSFSDMASVLALLDSVMDRFGFRRAPIVERPPLPSSAPRNLDVTFAEWEALGEWADQEVAAALAELAQMSAGTGRGAYAHELGLRVGTLVGLGLLDQNAIADRIFTTTFDDNAAYHSWPRGCEQSAGEAVDLKLQALRRPAALLEEAKALGVAVTGFQGGGFKADSASEVADFTGSGGGDVAPALRDRAATLGASRKSKAVTAARAAFSRLCAALAADGVISELEAFELGVLAKDYGHEANGKNPRLPAPDDKALAKVVVDTAAKGGNVGLTLVAGVAVLKPPVITEDVPVLEGGVYPADEEMFEVISARLAGVNRDGSIFYIHRTLDGRDETLSDRDLLKLFPNVFVGDEQGRELAVSWWLKHKRFKNRRAIFKVHGEAAPDEYNFWKGFGVERQAGRRLVRRFMRHLREIVCKRNKAKFKYLVKWMAWAVQNPDKNPETVVVLKSGAEGSGKSTVSEVMRVLFYKHAATISSPEQLLGKHNTHLEFASFVALEEALFAGDPRQASAMRSKITSPVLRIEPKFIGSYEAPNVMHAILTTNHEWAIHAGQAARRWFVAEVSEDRVGDRAYFDALYADLEAGGYGQLLDALLEVDLEGWHPRQVVKTDELAEQQRMSADTVAQWLRAAAEDDGIDYVSPAGTHSQLELGRAWHTATLYSGYCGALRAVGGRPVSRDVFSKRLMSILGAKRWSNHTREAEGGKEGRGYLIPPSAELEALLS